VKQEVWLAGVELARYGKWVWTDDDHRLVAEVLADETLLARYPRLIKAIQRVGLLSQSEAISAVRAHIFFFRNAWAACEAVIKYCRNGSTTELIRDAWCNRHKKEVMVVNLEGTSLKGVLWLGFTPDSDVEWAKRRFREKYGYEPDKVVHVPNLILVGPVRKDDDNVYRGESAQNDA